MATTDPDDGLDERIRWAVESLSRTLDRRRFLSRSMRTGFALFAGAALGSVQAIRAIAANGGCKPCTYIRGHTCNYYGYPCPSTQNPTCPSGCSVCTSGCSGWCGYASGWWTVTGCGTCGNGTVECIDCKCPDCAHACTCRTNCYCCNCCSPQDIIEELHRLGPRPETRTMHTDAPNRARPASST